MYGIIDCDNCYVSCERVFRPDLNGKPVVVLSNNDGCIVARSNEAKKLGIKAGLPYFQLQQQFPDQKIAVFSSNYELYGELTGRVDGDSMVEAGINDGDIAIIDRSVEASDGDVIVAFVNNEFTIKFLDLSHKSEGYIELRPANKKYHPIRINDSDDFEVWGVVVWTIRNWKK